jgi:hypothetical protein
MVLIRHTKKCMRTYERKSDSMDVKHVVFITHPGFAIQDRTTKKLHRTQELELRDYSATIPEARSFFENKILPYVEKMARDPHTVFVFLHSYKYTQVPNKDHILKPGRIRKMHGVEKTMLAKLQEVLNDAKERLIVVQPQNKTVGASKFVSAEMARRGMHITEKTKISSVGGYRGQCSSSFPIVFRNQKKLPTKNFEEIKHLTLPKTLKRTHVRKRPK